MRTPAKKETGLSKQEAMKNTIESIAKADLDSLVIQKNLDTLCELKMKYDDCTDDAEKAQCYKKMEGCLDTVRQAFGLDNRSLLVNSVPNDKQPLAVQICEELEKEYNVQTASERALVQSAVEGFIRSMTCSSILTNNRLPKSISHEWVYFIAVCGKEAERAQNQFLKALRLLQQMKAPPMNITINTKNAFVANNQQNNASTNQEKQ